MGAHKHGIYDSNTLARVAWKVRADDVENCNLFLLSKLASAKPGVLDGENITLQERTRAFYAGLLLSSPFAPAHPPVDLTGACVDGEIETRQHTVLEPPVRSLVHLRR